MMSLFFVYGVVIELKIGTLLWKTWILCLEILILLLILIGIVFSRVILF